MVQYYLSFSSSAILTPSIAPPIPPVILNIICCICCFSSHLDCFVTLYSNNVPKKSPTTGKQIPAFSKTDSAYIQMQNMYPEYKHLWDGREAVKSRIEETRAERFLESTRRRIDKNERKQEQRCNVNCRFY